VVSRDGCLGISCLVSTRLKRRVSDRIGGGIHSLTVETTVFRSLRYVQCSSGESIALRQSHRLSPHSHLDRVVSSQSDASDHEALNANRTGHVDS
jgi:hypothetical protein